MNKINAIYNYSSFGPFITVGGPGQWADATDDIIITIPETLKVWYNVMDKPMIEFPDGEAYPFMDVVKVRDDEIFIVFPNLQGKHWEYKAEYTKAE